MNFSKEPHEHIVNLHVNQSYRLAWPCFLVIFFLTVENSGFVRVERKEAPPPLLPPPPPQKKKKKTEEERKEERIERTVSPEKDDPRKPNKNQRSPALRSSDGRGLAVGRWGRRCRADAAAPRLAQVTPRTSRRCGRCLRASLHSTGRARGDGVGWEDGMGEGWDGGGWVGEEWGEKRVRVGGQRKERACNEVG